MGTGVPLKLRNAATAPVLGMLCSEQRTARRSPREQLEQLDDSTLARLLDLLAESKKGGAPAN